MTLNVIYFFHISCKVKCLHLTNTTSSDCSSFMNYVIIRTLHFSINGDYVNLQTISTVNIVNSVIFVNCICLWQFIMRCCSLHNCIILHFTLIKEDQVLYFLALIVSLKEHRLFMGVNVININFFFLYSILSSICYLFFDYK